MSNEHDQAGADEAPPHPPDEPSPDRDRPPAWTDRYDARDFPPFSYTADGVVFSFGKEAHLRVVTVERDAPDPFAGFRAWPGGFVAWEEDEDARATVLGRLRTLGLEEPAYLEALDTYDAFGRDPRQFAPHGARGVSKAFWGALDRQARDEVREGGRHARAPRWEDVYELLPWEDRRHGGAQEPHPLLEPLLSLVSEHAELSGERVVNAFGSPWNEERAGERIRILLDARILPEAVRDRWGRLPTGWQPPIATHLGNQMAFDHRVMLADALARLRGKIKYLPATLRVLAGSTFTLPDLFDVVSAVSGRPLDKPNFWRMLTRSKSAHLVEPTGRKADGSVRPGPPATLYRFVPEVHHLRLDPSLRWPFAGPD